ncbi:hypothetical protein, partial [Serratia bockelmannii]|uniref:hypothetical protein n=1 Tax=Serratia bockelmannii TaxID=2703793 RepID=UPI0036CC1A79
MVGISPSAIQQQCAQARVRIDGLKNGLKSVGWRWIPGKTSGIKKGVFAPFFNDLQTSMEFQRTLQIKIWSGKRGSNSRPQPWQG